VCRINPLFTILSQAKKNTPPMCSYILFLGYFDIFGQYFRFFVLKSSLKTLEGRSLVSVTILITLDGRSLVKATKLRPPRCKKL
jgi:hypothetical protein